MFYHFKSYLSVNKKILIKLYFILFLTHYDLLEVSVYFKLMLYAPIYKDAFLDKFFLINFTTKLLYKRIYPWFFFPTNLLVVVGFITQDIFKNLLTCLIFRI